MTRHSIDLKYTKNEDKITVKLHSSYIFLYHSMANPFLLLWRLAMVNTAMKAVRTTGLA